MKPISDEELSEFFDGGLDLDRRREVLQAVEGDANLSARMADYRQQQEGLHSLYDPVLDEAVPERFTTVLRTPAAGQARPRRRNPGIFRSSFALAAMIALVFVTGVGGGWGLNDYLRDNGRLLDVPIQQAVLSHQSLRLSVRPMEDATDRVTETLRVVERSNPFQVALRVPSKAGISGFQPVSFSQRVGPSGPTAEVLYRSGGGQLITLRVQEHSKQRLLPWVTRQVDGFDVVYWLDGPLLYVLVGEAGEEPLMGLADTFYAAPGVLPGNGVRPAVETLSAD